MACHPDFTIKEKEESQKAKEAKDKKETYPGLNRQMIEDCVNLIANANLTLEYKAINKMNDNKFTEIKKWFIQYLKDNKINYKELKASVELTRLEKVKETIKAEENNSEVASKSNSNITELINSNKEAVNQ